MRSTNNYNASGNNIRRSTNPYGIYSNAIDVEDTSSSTLHYYQSLLGPNLSALLFPAPKHIHDVTSPSHLQKRLQIYSSVVFGISLLFWCWAVHNTHHLRRRAAAAAAGSDGGGGMALDLGIVSFFGSGVASLLVLRAALGGRLLANYRRRRKEANGGLKDEEDVYFGGGRGSNARSGNAGGEGHSPPSVHLRAFLLLVR
ncbi:predicted protein [Thalassiosira pseudonana CCMP1335]|uniref:Uncharacterized protein n=1 Tax=Thalassiosira pseudonana TaxID=35128 RepID=B5YP58_THAPS|nr:predicted protein [Thalassiosira pseudonana CCMP1335]ACI64743.1 predicted protein [Thalassiosira pseudonana CCMP1335]